MNIPNETLDRLAELAFETNSRLLHAKDALASGRTERAGETLEASRSGNWRLLRALVTAGACDPLQAAIADTQRRIARMDPDEPVRREDHAIPLALLSSPAARRFAEAIRSAASACAAMETERGITDGLAETLADYAAIAELEVYGPAGLRGMEGGER